MSENLSSEDERKAEIYAKAQVRETARYEGSSTAFALVFIPFLFGGPILAICLASGWLMGILISVAIWITGVLLANKIAKRIWNP